MELSQLDLLLLNIGEAKHHADWNWANVQSPFARMYLIEAGTATIILPDQTIKLLPGNLYFIPAFTKHSCQCDDYFALTYIHIYEAKSLWGLIGNLLIPYEVQATDLDTLLFHRLLKINPQRELPIFDPQDYDNKAYLDKNIEIQETGRMAVKTETKGILLQLFSRFLTKAKSQSSSIDFRVLKISDYVLSNISKSFTLGELAELAHVSPDHLIRIFKTAINCTPIQFVNRKKIENAQIQLLTFERSIKEIAINLNFESSSYFIKLFRNQVGVSPTEYRNRTRIFQ